LIHVLGIFVDLFGCRPTVFLILKESCEPRLVNNFVVLQNINLYKPGVGVPAILICKQQAFQK